MKLSLLLIALTILPFSFASAEEEFHVVNMENLKLSDINTFIAPNVTNENNLPETTGLIVFDVNQNAFYGKGNVAGVTGWQPITPSAGSLVPSGIIMAYGGSSAPTGYLMCDGSSYLRTAYPNLFTAIGTAYGTADTSHFNVPDLRGRFVRGQDNGAGNDPDAASRTACNTGGNSGDNIGSCQLDQLASHSHTNPGYSTGGSSIANGQVNVQTSGGSFIGTNSTTAVGGNETRPKNVDVSYIIKL